MPSGSRWRAITVAPERLRSSPDGLGSAYERRGRPLYMLLLTEVYRLPILASLTVIAGILAVSILASLQVRAEPRAIEVTPGNRAV